mmetsp:Transcript_40052/g.104383  ORF Transcript_40052/g.104383 Transcript_40052/m.104383 type:complete len:212 (-) Transcript_40052:387-1022(-)
MVWALICPGRPRTACTGDRRAPSRATPGRTRCGSGGRTAKSLRGRRPPLLATSRCRSHRFPACACACRRTGRTGQRWPPSPGCRRTRLRHRRARRSGTGSTWPGPWPSSQPWASRKHDQNLREPPSAPAQACGSRRSACRSRCRRPAGSARRRGRRRAPRCAGSRQAETCRGSGSSPFAAGPSPGRTRTRRRRASWGCTLYSVPADSRQRR